MIEQLKSRSSQDPKELRTEDDQLIYQAGLKEVEQWLEERGYKDINEVSIDGQIDEINAKKNGKDILIKVRSSMYPVDPGFLTLEEKSSLLSRSASEDVDAIFARVWLEKDLKLKDKYIMWKRIRN